MNNIGALVIGFVVVVILYAFNPTLAMGLSVFIFWLGFFQAVQ